MMFRHLSGRWLAVIAATSLAAAGCVNRPIEKPAASGGREDPHYFPQSVEKDIDILFVIDNSNSMGEEQENLNTNFPKFIEALRSPKLNNKIPNVHLGVVSTNLGAGNYGIDTCTTPGGDGGRLQTTPRISGCTPASNPYISYTEPGVTNVKSSTTDPITQVKEAFQCVAKLGTGGCGFEHQLEAARRALDPAANVNPGFVRKDAYLAVVWLTDEDDCSAQKPTLFDSGQNNLTDPLGFCTSFRCFEFGVQCDINDRNKTGPRHNCKPAYDWLYPTSRYVSFLKGLKPPGRVIAFAVAGPTDKVEVYTDAEQRPTLRPSCQTKMGSAAPAIRMKEVMGGFGPQGHFNHGVDVTGTRLIDVSVCSDDYSPALRLFGKLIVDTLAAGR